jgi:rhodanese-related sulfurtransferase
MNSRQIQILDVRSREHFGTGHRAGARNIPSPELKARAPIELDSANPVVVDCLQPKATACRGPGWVLVDAGFREVSLLLR